MRLVRIGVFFLLVGGFCLAGQLTIDQIMEGTDFIGTSPSQVRWAGDSDRIYFRWREPGQEDSATYVIRKDGTGLQRLTDEEADEQAWPNNGVWNKARTQFLSTADGDIFIWNKDGTRRTLIKTRERESGAAFSRDENRVVFTRESNLYTLSLSDGSLVQVTDFRSGNEPKDKKLSDNRKFLKEEQEKLFEEFSGEKKKERDEREAERDKANAKAFYIGQGASVSNLTLSPDEKYVSFSWSKTSRDQGTVVPSYVTDDGFTRDLNARSKVGEEQGDRKLGFYALETGEVTWIEAAKDMAFAIGPRWSEKSGRVAIWTLTRDFNDRRIYTVNPENGEAAEVDHLHDDAWVAGPSATTFGWMPNGDDLYFISEADGWAHLYLVSYDGSNRRQLTQGQWEVGRVGLSGDESHWELSTSEGDLGQRHFYTMPLEGGARTQLTHGEGRQDVDVSPDGKRLAVLASTGNHPPELYYQAAQPDTDLHQLTHSTLEGFRSYNWIKPEMVSIPARDGVMVPARFYRPEHPAEGHPTVIFVHGAGYLQNAHKWWSSYYREYMFHHLLMEHGYHVLDIDYRGSAGYGRDWRTAIYRHMGGTDLTDQVDGARWLVSQHGVDPKRIGVYGGSYGGFITLMAMFTEPDVFAAGAALRPVTDWAHYNHIYTGRILNEPQDDPEAYEQSSPIYFADGLKGALLICHGVVDTNVHFQDTVRLVQRLIELRKESWEVAMYPVENHGFTNPTSWADEYKRIFKLFEENLK